MKKVLAMVLGAMLVTACGQTPVAQTPVAETQKAGPEAEVSPAVFRSPSCRSIGVLDGSFGGCTGKVMTGASPLLFVHPSLGLHGEAGAVAIQPDGKILVAGQFSTYDDNADLALVRLNTDGSLDTSFGSGGWVIPENSANRQNINTVKVMQDGKILIAGYAETFGGNHDYGLLARFNPDGSPDTGFNAGRLLKVFVSGIVSSMDLQSDGKIITYGATHGRGDPYLYQQVLARFNTDGSFDWDFAYPHLPDYTGGNIMVLSNDHIVVTRTTGDGLTVQAFDANGNTDTAFGNAGAPGQTVPWPTFNFYYTTVCSFNGSLRQPDDKIVVMGVCTEDGSPKFVMARLNSNGSLDTSFGYYGKLSDPALPKMNTLALQPNGNIVVAGSTGRGYGGINDDFLLARYNASGIRDTTWNGTGRITTGFPAQNGVQPSDGATALAVTSSGKIVAAGYSSLPGRKVEGFAVVRYNP